MPTPRNSSILRKVFLLLIVALFCSFACGGVIYVDDDGQADSATIQGAIDAAEHGDTVSVAPGVYFENVVLRSGVDLIGAGAGSTIIDAGGYGDVVDARADDMVISGFTLRNSGEFDLGHMNCGVYCRGDYALIVENNVITANRFGIGLWDEADLVVRNNVIENNFGGLYIYGSIEHPTNPTIVNNTIVNNQIDGITLRVMSSPSIINNIISGHTYGINHNYVTGSPVISHNNLWRNDVNYLLDNSSGDTLAGPGSLSVDPLFADSANGDYHLKSEAGRWDPAANDWVSDDITSPCIDAGDPNSPVGPEPVPNGSRTNIGAYGGTAEASKSPSGLDDKYSGGSGTAEDPYQIATAEDLMLLGEAPEDYDKHFILTADIDLDPILPGGRVFDKAVIAPHTDPTFCDRSGHCVYDDTAFFTGVFDGNGHKIWHLTIVGDSDLGLFGQLSGEVKDLGLADVNIAGSGSYIGGLAGAGSGTNCHVSGNVSGRSNVGGLAGAGGGTNCHSTATVSGDVYIGGLLGSGVALHCYSTGSVSGDSYVGGLIGESGWIVSQCYSTGTVHGNKYVGGLVGRNHWSPNVGEDGPAEIANCYSTANVDGNDCIGGLVGQNYYGPVTNCYAAGVVSGAGSVGGLVGHGDLGTVTACFWDIDTSGQATSDGGTGMITAEMQTGARFLIWGMCDNEGIWTIDEGKDYPRLSWENRRGEPIRMPELADLLLGSGTENDPFLIYTHEELNAVGLYPCEWDKHFRLMADIDLDPALPGRKIFDGAVIASDTDPGNSAFRGIPFTGIFDGSGHTISHLTIIGGGYLGLFGRLGPGAELTDLGVVDVNITGSGDYVGGLVGHSAGLVTRCYSTGTASGHYYDTYAYVGGLVGFNDGSIATSYSTVSASGGGAVGGLVGRNRDDVRNCYSTGAAIGKREVGGLVGSNDGSVTASYSTATVSGGWAVGGLVGWSDRANVATCFWDIEISGFPWGYSAGVTGKTTAEMQTAKTFLEAGWDFLDETTNGADDIWWILEGQDYPRLWWELIAEK